MSRKEPNPSPPSIECKPPAPQFPLVSTPAPTPSGCGFPIRVNIHGYRIPPNWEYLHYLNKDDLVAAINTLIQEGRINL